MVGVSFVLEGAQAGYAILALLVLFSLARGFNSIAAKDVLGKVIPKKKRGNISGLAASIAGFATLTFGLMMWFFFGAKRAKYGINCAVFRRCFVGCCCTFL